MKAFLTGSRRYGVPRDDSDTDMVILVDQKDHALFESLNKISSTDQCSGGPSNFSVRIGRLNLIVLTDLDEYEAWRCVAEDLEKIGGVTREVACDAHKNAMAELSAKRGKQRRLENLQRESAFIAENIRRIHCGLPEMEPEVPF